VGSLLDPKVGMRQRPTIPVAPTLGRLPTFLAGPKNSFAASCDALQRLHGLTFARDARA
jgi:hypothetical protein